MAHEQPKRAAEMGQAVSDQKGAELQGCARNPTSPALWVSEGAAKPLSPAVDTISIIKWHSHGPFALFPVAAYKNEPQTEILPIVIAYRTTI